MTGLVLARTKDCMPTAYCHPMLHDANHGGSKSTCEISPPGEFEHFMVAIQSRQTTVKIKNKVVF